MLLGRVIGQVVPCIVCDGLQGVPMLLVQPLDKKLQPKGKAIVAADGLGAEECVELPLPLDSFFVLPGVRRGFVPGFVQPDQPSNAVPLQSRLGVMALLQILERFQQDRLSLGQSARNLQEIAEAVNRPD